MKRGVAARSADFLEWTTFKFWGVVAFTLVAFAVYERASKITYAEIDTFTQQLNHLKARQHVAYLEEQELQDQLNSLNDPAWIEMTLIRELGLVPQHHSKVVLNKGGER